MMRMGMLRKPFGGPVAQTNSPSYDKRFETVFCNPLYVMQTSLRVIWSMHGGACGANGVLRQMLREVLPNNEAMH